MSMLNKACQFENGGKMTALLRKLALAGAIVTMLASIASGDTIKVGVLIIAAEVSHPQSRLDHGTNLRHRKLRSLRTIIGSGPG
jgi:hypothetical protein